MFQLYKGCVRSALGNERLLSHFECFGAVISFLGFDNTPRLRLVGPMEANCKLGSGLQNFGAGFIKINTWNLYIKLPINRLE